MILHNEYTKFKDLAGKKLRHFTLLTLLILVTFSTPNAFGLNLKTGDIILQPLNCWSCFLIEAQEKSIYSHMGMYLKINNEDYVLEALGEVRIVSLEEFMAKTERGESLLVRRMKDIKFDEQDLIEKSNSLLGHEYDADFIWDNYDENGLEKLYCSELIYKVFENYYTGLPIKRMKYDIYREHWIRYFNGLPPDGKWGNAPADFEKSNLFYDVGYL